MKKILAMLVLLLSLTLCMVSCNGAKNDDGTTPDTGSDKPADTTNDKEDEKPGNTTVDVEAEKYAAALNLIKEGKYAEAQKALSELGDYKDAKKLLTQFYYVPSAATLETDDEVLTAEFFYDENNLPTRTALTGEDGITKNAIFTYDNNLDLIKEFFEDHEYGDTTYTYTYDESRRVIKEVYATEETVIYTIDREYDESGKLSKVTQTYPEEELSHCYSFTYDDKGKMVTELYTSSNGDSSTTVFTYDENGKKLKGVCTYSDGTISESVYTYDENGNMIKDTYIYDGEVADFFEYTYDANGNLIKEVYIVEGDLYFSYEYTYDEQGNATKIVHTDDEGSVEIKNVEYKLVYISVDVTDQIDRIIKFYYL